jgi:hypothetical protein
MPEDTTALARTGSNLPATVRRRVVAHVSRTGAIVLFLAWLATIPGGVAAPLLGWSRLWTLLPLATILPVAFIVFEVFKRQTITPSIESVEQPRGLPPASAALSPALQRLLEQTRSFHTAIEPDTEPLEIYRLMFEWHLQLGSLEGDDARALQEAGISPANLQVELAELQQHSDAAARAIAILDRVENNLLHSQSSPFR